VSRVPVKESVHTGNFPTNLVTLADTGGAGVPGHAPEIRLRTPVDALHPPHACMEPNGRTRSASRARRSAAIEVLQAGVEDRLATMSRP